MVRKRAEQSGVMSDDAQRLQARMDRLGITDSELSRESADDGPRVDRATVAAIRKGQGFRRDSLTRLERTLDRLETEAGLDAEEPSAPAERTTFTARSGDAEVTVVVEGPVTDREALEASIVRMLTRIRETGRDPS